MPRLIYVVTHPMSARLLMRGQLAFMRERGFEVTVLSAPGEDLHAAAEREKVRAISLPFQREIAPLQDARVLAKLYQTVRDLQPDIVNASTPKGGLLGMIAARMANVPVRIYTLRGLRLETTHGATQLLLNATERIASACAHEVLAVSHSLRGAYLERGLAPAHKVRVLGMGSSNGIDLNRFERTPGQEAAAKTLRARLGLPEGAPVIGFVGRFTRDKGIVELIRSFERVRKLVPEARLLLVGDFEAGDPVPAKTRRSIETDNRIVQAGFVSDVVPYYHLMDVLAFPSHREGFPNVPLEAAAAGVPTVGFQATGTVDAVQDGQTGTLVPTGAVHTFAEVLVGYLTDDKRREICGRAAQARARKDFNSLRVWEALYDEYVRLLRAKNCPLPHSASSTRPVLV